MMSKEFMKQGMKYGLHVNLISRLAKICLIISQRKYELISIDGTKKTSPLISCFIMRYALLQREAVDEI